ncbi:MAG TPA: hypothetical protein VMW49_07755 [Candidatus Dormibacteraeota bacterium]|nr:hypothetical protein [Candidatus Dormibacteraeota bacterium]
MGRIFVGLLTLAAVVVAGLAAAVGVGHVYLDLGFTRLGTPPAPPLSWGGELQDSAVGASPGQSVTFGGYLLNRGPRPLVVEGASLVAADGQPLPKLVGVGILTNGTPGTPPPTGVGWPPPEGGLAGAHPYPVSPLLGAVLPPAGGRGGRSPSVRIVLFGVAAPAPGTYFSAGLEITYRVGRHTYHGTIWSVGELCAQPGGQAVKVCSTAALQLGDQVLQAVARRAGA